MRTIILVVAFVLTGCASRRAFDTMGQAGSYSISLGRADASDECYVLWYSSRFKEERQSRSAGMAKVENISVSAMPGRGVVRRTFPECDGDGQITLSLEVHALDDYLVEANYSISQKLSHDELSELKGKTALGRLSLEEDARMWRNGLLLREDPAAGSHDRTSNGPDALNESRNYELRLNR